MPSIYIGHDQDCEYLPAYRWRHIFFTLDSVSPESMDELLLLGFRHFGNHFFRNACLSCNECRGIRLELDQFHPSKSQKRVLSKNSDLKTTVTIVQPNHEVRELVNLWQRNRETKNNWSPRPFEQDEFEIAFQTLGPSSKMLLVRDSQNKLLAVSMLDKGLRCGNSIYACFHPDYEKRSLGTYTLLKEIEYLKEENCSFHYLGHYNSKSASLSYKIKFQKAQITDYRHLLGAELFQRLQLLPEFLNP